MKNKERYFFPQFKNVDWSNWELANDCAGRLFSIGLSDTFNYNDVMELYLEYIDIDNLYGHWNEKKLPI